MSPPEGGRWENLNEIPPRPPLSLHKILEMKSEGREEDGETGKICRGENRNHHKR